MKCACGGNSEVLERRGQRRRRRCLDCGQRWTTVEVRVGVKPVALPPALAKLGKQAKLPKKTKPVAIEPPELEQDDITPYLPEICLDE